MEEMLALYSYTGPGSEKDTGRMATDLPNMTLDKVRSNTMTQTSHEYSVHWLTVLCF